MRPRALKCSVLMLSSRFPTHTTRERQSSGAPFGLRSITTVPTLPYVRTLSVERTIPPSAPIHATSMPSYSSLPYLAPCQWRLGSLQPLYRHEQPAFACAASARPHWEVQGIWVEYTHRRAPRRSPRCRARGGALTGVSVPKRHRPPRRPWSRLRRPRARTPTRRFPDPGKGRPAPRRSSEPTPSSRPCSRTGSPSGRSCRSS